MRGHVRERGQGSWELRAYVGRDPLASGKRYKPKTVRAKGQREAERALAAFVMSLEAGIPATGTFGELVERWIETASPGWSPANQMTVRNTVTYDLPPLMPLRLDRIRTAGLDAFYAALRSVVAAAASRYQPPPYGECTPSSGGTRAGSSVELAADESGGQRVARSE